MRNMESLVRKTVLPNGLTVVTERMPFVRSVSLGIWIQAGSRTDRMETMGMAHFIEHMMFKGTEHRSVFEIADSLESLGGSLNAFTSRDMTCYYASVLDEHLEVAVDVLSDILNHSLFAPEEIEREKLVVLEEIRSALDVPEELVQDVFGDTLLSPDPAGKPILGIPETISAFTRDDLTSYIASHYTAPNMLIAATGNVEHDRIVDIVSSQYTFGDAKEKQELQYIESISGKRIDIIRDIQQAHVCSGGPTFGYTDERRVPLWLLNTLLGSGMSSRLFQNIREKHGLTYSIYSFTELLSDRGFITTYAATEVGRLERTIDLIHDEYRKLVESPLDDATLNRVKSQLKGSLVLSLESTSNRMSRLAKQEILLGEYFTMDDTIAQIERVTPDQVQEVAQTIFDDSQMRTVVVTPQKGRKSVRGKKRSNPSGA